MPNHRDTLALAAGLLLLSQPAMAQDFSAQFAEQGIAGTVTALSAIEDPTPSDRFALGGAFFLRGIEAAFQERYRTGLTDIGVGIPGLYTVLEPNPAPEPFTPDVIARLFTQIGADMDLAQEVLSPISSDDAVAVTLDLNQIWFDINANGTRDAGEDLLPVMVPLFVRPWQVEDTLAQLDAAGGAPTIAFDTSDAAWLQAYTHVFAGTAEMVLAFDPTEVITTVQSNAATITDLRQGPLGTSFVTEDDEAISDLITILLKTLAQQPDPAHTRAALEDFRDVISHNLVFWDRVRAETDNDQEFIPNNSQQSALGLLFPANIDTAWQAVLKDAAMVLEGKLLIPHWRMGDDVGINLNAWLTNPTPVDVIGMLAGTDLAPYVERGPLADAQAMNEVNEATGRNFTLFAFTLN